MMDLPLTIGWILEQAERSHRNREIVWREEGGGLERYTYGDFAGRVARLAHALIGLGIRSGDRVASFAWSAGRHLELYYAVPMIGAVLHTVNVRLFPEQVRELLEHADDRCIFVDSSLAPVLARALACGAPFRRPCVLMGGPRAELADALDYDALVAGRPATYAWPELDERSAAMLCYTSATTGDSKGIAFSHRSMVLQALQGALGDAFGVRERDVVLPLPQMFHVAAWSLPFIAPLIGAKLVLPGSALDAGSVIELIEREKVTLALGVPTVWLGVRDALQARGYGLPTLERIIVGGSAMPPRLFDDLQALGISVVHSWGMTEISPSGTFSRIPSVLADESSAAKRAARLKQGAFVPLVAWKIRDEEGREVACDGRARGQLWVRGHTVTGRYYRDPSHSAFKDGWLATGDVCTIDEHGCMEIVDREKDLIKSGGEWIASVALENMLMGHSAVKEAAVVGVAHPKWMERPIACVVLHTGHDRDEDALRAWLAQYVAKWQIPDRIVFLDTIPRTGVGKFLKRELRERYGGILLG